MERANQEIRQAVKNRGLRLWQLADALGVNDGNLSRKLRRELPENEKRQILLMIENLSKGVKNGKA